MAEYRRAKSDGGVVAVKAVRQAPIHLFADNYPLTTQQQEWGANLATLDNEIKAAERKMRQAYDALIEYVERPASQPGDIKLHRRLADDLTLANAQYVTLVSKLKSSGSEDPSPAGR